MSKYSRQEVADIVENEGLGYAIMDFMGGEHIADPELAALWDQASEILTQIRDILEPYQRN